MIQHEGGAVLAFTGRGVSGPSETSPTHASPSSVTPPSLITEPRAPPRLGSGDGVPYFASHSATAPGSSGAFFPAHLGHRLILTHPLLPSGYQRKNEDRSPMSIICGIPAERGCARILNMCRPPLQTVQQYGDVATETHRSRALGAGAIT